MRILITTPDLSLPGGVSAYYKALRGWLPQGVEYFTVGARAGEGGARRWARCALDCLRFARTVAGGGWDLVHLNPSFGWKALLRDGVLLWIARCWRIPVVVQFHGWDWRCARMVHRRFETLFVLSYGRAGGFVVLAEEFREALKAMRIASPVFVEAATVEDWRYDAAEQRSGGGEARMLFLSRVERGKGIYETLEAFQALRARHPRLELCVAGGGPELTPAQRLVEERGIAGVRFLGEVQGERKHAAFSQAEIFVLPSYAEGMPLALLEAMAHGLAVVTTAVGGIRDFFRPGRMGYLIPVRDAASLAEAVERLLADAAARARMGAANRAFAAARFMPWTAAGRMGRIHQAVAAKRSGIQETSWLDAGGSLRHEAAGTDEAAAAGTAAGGRTAPNAAGLHAGTSRCAEFWER
jgi:glycosyltransferase involved in cell wall biosynthesis